MTVHDVLLRVSEVRSHAGDDERAHSMEDALWADVLKAIAEGEPNADMLAAAALRTKDFDFARWCA